MEWNGIGSSRGGEGKRFCACISKVEATRICYRDLMQKVREKVKSRMSPRLLAGAAGNWMGTSVAGADVGVKSGAPSRPCRFEIPIR